MHIEVGKVKLRNSSAREKEAPRKTVRPQATKRIDSDFPGRNSYSAFWNMEEVPECDGLVCSPCCSVFHYMSSMRKSEGADKQRMCWEGTARVWGGERRPIGTRGHRGKGTPWAKVDKPTQQEGFDHTRTHVPFRTLCPFCVRSRCRTGAHQGNPKTKEKLERDVPVIWSDYMGSKARGLRVYQIDSLPMIAGFDRPMK